MTKPTINLSVDDLTLLLSAVTAHSALIGDQRAETACLSLIEPWAELDGDQQTISQRHARDLGVRIYAVLAEHRVRPGV